MAFGVAAFIFPSLNSGVDQCYFIGFMIEIVSARK